MPRATDPTAADLHASGSAFDPAAYEESNVHEVYEAIASHFSDTRYKQWPLVSAFLASLPSGAVGADLGCGNGKYLGVRSSLASSRAVRNETAQADDDTLRRDNDIVIIGMDRSSNLVDLAAHNFASALADGGKEDRARMRRQSTPIESDEIDSTATQRRNEVAVSDALHSSLRKGSVDFAISIATIHHMTTWARRRDAVLEMIRIIRPSLNKNVDVNDTRHDYPGLGTGAGRFLIVVWALEQRGHSRRRFEQVDTSMGETLEGSSFDSGLGHNHMPCGKDLLVPWILKRENQGNSEQNEQAIEPKIYQRFYHVFCQGELEALVEDAAAEASKRGLDVEVEQETTGWERGNWYGIWRCKNAKR